MHKLEDLKEMLCNQLEEYADKELTAGTLDVVDKLSHTIKNLDKIIDKYEDTGYSNNMYPERYDRPLDHSYARRRDSMGRYSRNADTMAELHELMNNATDERSRQIIRDAINQMQK